MSDFKWFKDTTTGLTGKYPAHFANMSHLEEVSSSEADCVDCGLDEQDLPVEVENNYNSIMERFKENG